MVADNTIIYSGEIVFDPINKTNKHLKQDSWKKIAYVKIGSDVCEYYSWFIKKRYGFDLNRSIRGAHVTFINDHIKDISGNSRTESEALWKEVKKKYNGIKVNLNIDLDCCTNGAFWWLPVVEEDRAELQAIRSELGLGRPFFGMHMTIGSPNEHNRISSDYFHNLLSKGIAR